MKWGVELVTGDVHELGGVASFSLEAAFPPRRLAKISLVSVACEGMQLFWLISSALHCFPECDLVGLLRSA